MWISKHDLLGIVPKWTVNIADDNFNPHALDAQESLKLLIPAALYTALDTMVAGNYNQWDKNTTYAEDDYAYLDDVLYIAIGATTNNVPPNATYWSVVELYDIYRDYLRRYLIYTTAASYLLWADKFFSQEGSRRVITLSSEPITADELASLINDLQNKANRSFMAFQKWMGDNQNTIDDVAYTGTTNADFKAKLRIRQV